MDFESSIEKLDKYYERLEKGKAQKIKPSHVEKVIHKLQSKEKSLLAEIADTQKESKIKRLKRKLELLREQQDRARWLQKKIDNPSARRRLKGPSPSTGQPLCRVSAF